ncbi:ElyC/SanA/YdcF family protein [Nocardia sp. NPDC019395]|uniref:ElyC/SanA/YdcF family protein n=1 Tax=Nocardia sp. NPDC019395 TaxID=3154686 RepID=UPI00340D71B9
MNNPFDAGRAVAVAQLMGTKVRLALTSGASALERELRGRVDALGASAGTLIRSDARSAIEIDRAGQALIRDDQVVGGRVHPAHAAWFQELRDRGVDTVRFREDLDTVMDFLRDDPKWAFDSDRRYDAALVFGSPDLGTSSFVGNFMHEHALDELPVVFSGWKGEAAKFRTAAERRGLNPYQAVEEPRAQNTRENVTRSVEELDKRGNPARSVLAFCTPQHARRVWATIKKQHPDVEDISIVTANISAGPYTEHGLRSPDKPVPSPGEITRQILLEVRGLRDSPASGHIVEQEIPDNVLEAFDRMSRIIPLDTPR